MTDSANQPDRSKLMVRRTFCVVMTFICFSDSKLGYATLNLHAPTLKGVVLLFRVTPCPCHCRLVMVLSV